MVYGLEMFQKSFEKYSDQYVLIGGTACSILMDEIGAPFRVTKDLDVVLILEVLDTGFTKAFWKFIEEGRYEHRNKSTGGTQFYRFSNPGSTGYPFMIELFSRAPFCFDLHAANGLTPIPSDGSVLSLSAILLNESYYNHLIKHRRKIEGCPILDLESVILFKIRVWLDLDARKKTGESIDSKHINKHRNDIFRLLGNISSVEHAIDVADEIFQDVQQFCVKVVDDKPDLINLGLKKANFEQMMDILMSLFIPISP